MKKTPKDELLDYKNIYKTKKKQKVKEDVLKTSITYFWYIHKVRDIIETSITYVQKTFWDIYKIQKTSLRHSHKIQTKYLRRSLVI